MADNPVKPIATALTAVRVGQVPPKQTNQPAQRRMVGPPNLYASAAKPIAKSGLPTKSLLEIELAVMDRAWRTYRSNHDRDAVYIYLASVFDIVMRWRRLNCALNKSRAALRLRPNSAQLKPEPFGIVIFCTADPKIVDAKTRSKWSRVLRYAAQAKPPGQRLTDFIKSKGGLNECARKVAVWC